jgi:hypothetical protein
MSVTIYKSRKILRINLLQAKGRGGKLRGKEKP